MVGVSKDGKEQGLSAPRPFAVMPHEASRVVQLLEPCLDRRAVQEVVIRDRKLKVPPHHQQGSLYRRKDDKRPFEIGKWPVGKAEHGRVDMSQGWWR